MKRTLSLLLVIAISTQSTLADAQMSPPNMAAVSAREYYVARDMGKPLVTVHLLNGVTAPGVYHVPIDTNVAQLIAYAGGALPTSDLGDITIRRGQRANYQITNLDLDKALQEKKELILIQDQDIVQIDQKFNADKPLQWVGIVSAIASIFLSVYLVEDIRKR